MAEDAAEELALTAEEHAYLFGGDAQAQAVQHQQAQNLVQAQDSEGGARRHRDQHFQQRILAVLKYGESVHDASPPQTSMWRRVMDRHTHVVDKLPGRMGQTRRPGAASAFAHNPYADRTSDTDDAAALYLEEPSPTTTSNDNEVRFFHGDGEINEVPPMPPDDDDGGDNEEEPTESNRPAQRLSVVWRSVQATAQPPPPNRTPVDDSSGPPPPFQSRGRCVLMHTGYGVSRGARQRPRTHYFSRNADRDAVMRSDATATWGRCNDGETRQVCACQSVSRVPMLKVLAARVAAVHALPHIASMPPTLQLSMLPTSQHAMAQALMVEMMHHVRLDRRMLAMLLAAGVSRMCIRNLWELTHIDAVGWEGHRFGAGLMDADERARARAERADAVMEVPPYLLEADEDGLWQLGANSWTRLFREAVDGRPGGGRLLSLSLENDVVEDDHAADTVAAVMLALDDGLSIRMAAAQRARKRFALAARQVKEQAAERAKSAQKDRSPQKLTRVAADALRGAAAAMAARRAAADAVDAAEEEPPRTPEATSKAFHALRVAHFDTVTEATLRPMIRKGALASCLTVVCLSHLPQITDKCVRLLIKHCTSLRTLALEHLAITDEAFRDFGERGESVRELHLKSLPFVQMRDGGAIALLNFKALRVLTMNAPWPTEPELPMRINRTTLTSLRLLTNLTHVVLNVEYVHGKGGDEPEPEPTEVKRELDRKKIEERKEKEKAKAAAKREGGKKKGEAGPGRGERRRRDPDEDTTVSKVNNLPVYDLRSMQLPRLRVLELGRTENVCFPYEFDLWTESLQHLTLSSNVGSDGEGIVQRLAGLRTLRSLRVVDGSAMALEDLEALVSLARAGTLELVVVGCASSVVAEPSHASALQALRSKLKECHFHDEAEPRTVACGTAFGMACESEGWMGGGVDTHFASHT
ncbi:hypothetical protein NFJ02_30g77800 [Pycnococcus provasolii]